MTTRPPITDPPPPDVRHESDDPRRYDGSQRALLRPFLGTRIGATLPLGALFVLASAILAWYAVRVHTFQPDEYIYVTQGRGVAADFPGALFDPHLFYLGPERISPLLGAFSTALFSTWDALAVYKALNAVVFASAMLPVYLLGRGIGLGKGASLLGSALTVAIPWAPLSTSFLTDAVAYPAFLWAVYGAWRAAVFPGWRSDVLGLALVALAPLARTNLVVMIVPLVVAVGVAELRWEGGARSWVGARASARRHVPLLAVLGLGLAYAASRGLGALHGVYPVDLIPPLDQLLAKSAKFLSYLAKGLVLVPIAVAVAWILRHLVAPLDRERHILALVVATATAVLLYSLNGSVLQERYVMYLGALALLLMIAGFVRRDVPVRLVAVTAIATAALVAVADRFAVPRATPDVEATAQELAGPYATFAYPGQSWWDRTLQGQATVRLPHPIAEHPEAVLLVLFTAMAVGGMWAARRSGRLGRFSIGALLALQLALGLAVAGWALDQYLTRAGAPEGPDFKDRAWVDRNLPAGERASGLVAQPNPANTATIAEVLFFNERYGGGEISTRALERRLAPDGTLAARLGRYVLATTSYRSVGIAARRLAQAPYVASVLLRPERPLRATWLVRGPDADGWLAAKGAAQIKTWRRCLAMTVIAAPDQPARVRLFDGSGVIMSRRLAPAQRIRLVTRRPGSSTLSAQGRGTLPPRRFVSAQLTDLTSVPCS